MSVEKNRIAQRATREIHEGVLVNLGIGLPTLVSNYTEDKRITFQSENGMIEIGSLQDSNDPNVDKDISNTGGMPVTILTLQQCGGFHPIVWGMDRRKALYV